MLLRLIHVASDTRVTIALLILNPNGSSPGSAGEAAKV